MKNFPSPAFLFTWKPLKRSRVAQATKSLWQGKGGKYPSAKYLEFVQMHDCTECEVQWNI